MRETVRVASSESLQRKVARFAARTIRTRTVEARPHPPLVTFTFDDIPESAAVVGGEILEKAGVRGTFYVAGGLMEQPLGGDGPGGRHASAEQCLALHRSGHEIGCHSFSHRPVSDLGHSELATDIARNAALLAELDPGLAASSFAYPFNTTSLRAKRQLERHFASCRGGVPGINAGTVDLGFLRAVELADSCLGQSDTRAWIARAVTQRGWLVFFSHGIGEDAGRWGCRPDLLRAAVSQAREQGAVVATMREALTHVCGQVADGRAEGRSS